MKRASISGKQKRNQNSKEKQNTSGYGGIDNIEFQEKLNLSGNSGFDNLSDDLLVKILSRISIKEAARMSVLGHRWRYLWRLVYGALRFHPRDTATGEIMTSEQFCSWVNAVVGLHQGRSIEGMVISLCIRKEELYRLDFYRLDFAIDRWVYFALNKEVQKFELKIYFRNTYIFPNRDLLEAFSEGFSSPFYSLRSLKLVNVDIHDMLVHYFLRSCPSLEELHIINSYITNAIIVDYPPKLRVLYISKCISMTNLVIYATSLVSLTFKGEEDIVSLRSVPNLRELTIGGGICASFVLESMKHSSYSSQLEKLVLDFRTQIRGYEGPIVASPDLPLLCSLKQLKVQLHTRDLLFFTSLIKASPQLSKFRIEVEYAPFMRDIKLPLPLPVISAANAVKFVHSNLKEVEMDGYVGCSAEEEMLLELIKIGPSIEKVVIATKSDRYNLQLRRLRKPHEMKQKRLPDILCPTFRNKLMPL